MSVTVADLLKLPSLREAKVLGGRGGLSQIVSSISVLESTDPSVLVDNVFHNDEFCGSEIVITGFLHITRDIEMQCANIRRLAEGGEVGLILYYVGVYLPAVDHRLVELADKLNFVLISMPEDRKDLRYSEVITDVTNCIFKDRMSSDALAGEILDRVSRLPQHQRTVDTVLKMLSDRISASFVLLDDSRRILNLAAWPRSIASSLKDGLEQFHLPPPGGEPCKCPFIPSCAVYCFPVSTEQNRMFLLIFKEGEPLRKGLLQQILDVFQLSVNIWGAQHDEIAIHELVRAIMLDEPMKMRRLADIFHIDVTSIHEMWILCGERADTPALFASSIDRIKSILTGSCGTVVADVYENKLILFLDGPRFVQDAELLTRSVLKLLLPQDDSVTLTRCSNLQNTTEVRQAYLCHQSSLADARKIYPHRQNYLLGEIQFAQQCRELVERGEKSVERCLNVLSDLSDSGNPVLEKTLEVFLLDGDSSVTKTSELLFIHKNTVKYRIQRISNLLGFRPDQMPESLKIYQAVAVLRLLS